MRSARPSEQVRGLWKKICRDLNVEKRVPLFATEDDGLTVRTTKFGDEPQRPVLQRSDEMERRVVDIAKQLVDDYNNHKSNFEPEHEFDGMLYMMGWQEDDGSYLPLYVGKTETLGRKGDGRLSQNLKGVDKGKNHRYFARWGYHHDYHIGDLSACVLLGHPESKQQLKYKKWARTLFQEDSLRTPEPKLKRRTYFWARAWEPTKPALWEELGPTTLAVSEYLVIGVAGKINPDTFLNRDGVPRQYE